MSRIVFAFMYLVHFLPLRVVAAVGEAAGSLFFWLIPERRSVTRTNLRKCFPGMAPAERERLARRHFRAFCRSFIERGILWWAPRRRIESMVRIEGLEHLKALEGRRVIIFAPHFVGLDAAFLRLTCEFSMATMYSHQKDPLFDSLLSRGRARFGAQLLPRRGGVRASLRAIKEGALYYYLPDLDYGRTRAVFVPFFGVPAATVTALSYIARLSKSVVLPCVTRMRPEGGYVARFYPAWHDFPSADDTADARRMLSFIEERVLEMPEQYWWLHKRFKTRPDGEESFY
jgi:Kdo2-lipid IVA lauroyltransferase/acyltransferase